jgi:ribosomal protein L22
MSPDTPANPSQGRPEDDTPLEAQEVTEATSTPEPETVAQPEPEPSTPAEPEAEGSAAAETGVDKKAAEAVTPTQTTSSSGTGKRTRRRDAKPATTGERTAQPGVTVRAQAKYVRTSARKARLVCDHIRGKDVEQARAILAFTPRGAAEAWSKLLESAVANAENNHELVGDELRIASVHADEGPTLKRFRPRAMGRATKIRKRTSHLTITLTPKD